MIVCRKKPNTKCSSVPHRVCELVTMIPNLSVAIPLNTGEGLCMFQTAPWDLPPSDYEQVWKVAGDQVQVTIFKYFRSFINYLPRQEPSSNCNKFIQNVCTTVGDFYLSIPTCSNWPYSGDWHPMQPSASWDLWASSQAALQLDSQGSLHQRKLLFVCLSCFWGYS